MKILFMALCLPLVLMSSCNAMTPTVAERCVWVDLHAQKGKALIPVLDAFAEHNNLIPNKSHPINPRYAKLNDEGAVNGEVSYLIGMGKFGAQLAIYRFDQTQNADLLNVFDRLVEEKIAPNYKVTQCAVHQLPTAYR